MKLAPQYRCIRTASRKASELAPQGALVGHDLLESIAVLHLDNLGAKPDGFADKTFE
jgi:hypothetical protein